MFGGAIAEVMKDCDKVINQAWDQAMNAISSLSANAQLSACVNLDVQLPAACLSVPLMSISKQIEDVMKKIYVIKEIIRIKAQ